MTRRPILRSVCLLLGVFVLHSAAVCATVPISLQAGPAPEGVVAESTAAGPDQPLRHGLQSTPAPDVSSPPVVPLRRGRPAIAAGPAADRTPDAPFDRPPPAT